MLLLMLRLTYCDTTEGIRVCGVVRNARILPDALAMAFKHSAPMRPPRPAAYITCRVVVLFVGEAALANELLPSTKGHGMGW